jgi:sulfatase modifying factor 1
MLDKRLKWALFSAAVVFAGLPVAGIILDVMRPGRVDVQDSSAQKAAPAQTESAPPTVDDMVMIPAGRYLRGYDKGGFDEKPEGLVTVDSYWIDRFEVTYDDYLNFVSATGRRKPISRYVKHFEKISAPRQPAVYVSWEDANEYCRYRHVRLPTEAEWEIAARGPQGFLWPWGTEDKPGWANTGNSDSAAFTSVVGTFSHDRSPFGVYDMGGNAMEWVADWYQEDGYKDSGPNPRGPSTGFYKVIRGASWDTTGKETRVTIRLKMIPEFRDTTIGFRCAKSTAGDDEKQEQKTP